MAKKKSLLKKIGKYTRQMGKGFSNSPVARAARGKHTKGYL